MTGYPRLDVALSLWAGCIALGLGWSWGRGQRPPGRETVAPWGMLSLTPRPRGAAPHRLPRPFWGAGPREGLAWTDYT